MGINKVVFGNETLLDISDTTATASDVATGKKFYKSDGTAGTGTAVLGGGLEELVSGNTFSEYDCGNITQIRPYAFAYSGSCDVKALNVTSLGPSCFYDSEVEKVYLGQITSIPDNAFYSCNSMTENNINFENVSGIGQYAFDDCSNWVYSGTIGATLIKDYAFRNTYKLGNIIFSNNIHINDSGFKNSGITSAVFEGTCYLSSEVFRGCSNLETVKFKGNTELQWCAVGFCSSLQTVIFNSSNVSLDSASFNGDTAITDIYVPWAEGAIPNAPWGATNATVHYETTFDSDGEPV